MAEFSEVIRTQRRMCKAFPCFNCENEYGIKCPIYVDGCPMEALTEQDSTIAPETIEAEIVKWAEEHPDPGYPTWLEWLEANGVAYKHPEYPDLIVVDYEAAQRPIPEDIAERHDIPPKE